MPLLAALLLLLAGCARAPALSGTPGAPTAPRDPAVQPPTVYWYEPFETLEPDRWINTDVSKGPTLYSVVQQDGRSCLRAVSQDSASILLSPLKFDPEKYEWLSWEWRVERFVEGEALERKDGSDAAARVYVYFQTMGLPWQKRSLDYVWSNSLPRETLFNSAFAPASKILIVDSGPAPDGEWRMVERNLEEDFERAFGRQDLPEVIGIGIMTDSDNSKGSAVAYFDNLRVSRSPVSADAADR